MSLPEIKEIPGGYHFNWVNEMVFIEVSRLHAHKDGRVTGEVVIKTSAPGYSPHLHGAQINFSSSETRNRLAKQLNVLYQVDWIAILEQLSMTVLKRSRQGEPVVHISTKDEIKPTQYLLEPVLPLNMPTVIFGEGGAGKGHIALAFAVCALLSLEDNGLSIIPRRANSKLLYLDWEADEDEIRRRAKYIQNGMGLDDVEFDYRRCALPLVDDMTQIQSMIADTQSDFIIVDSIGPASGGDLNAADPAIRLFSAIRQLHVTSLLIGHTSKDNLQNKKTIIGSSYYTNLARSIWELKKVQEVGSDKIQLGLFHNKSNNSKLYPPMGYEIDFADSFISVESIKVSEIDELVKHLSVPAQIIKALKNARRGLSLPEFEDLVEAKQNTIIQSLGRMVEKKQLVKMGNTWGLAAREN